MTYVFDEFRFEAVGRLLFKGSEIVSLSPKAGEVLLAFIESDGKLLTKQELLDLVWAETFVEEANLAQHISALRKTLGEDNNGRRFIETIPRKGYRFVAPIQKLGSPEIAEIVVSERTTAHLIEKTGIETTSESSFAPAPVKKNNSRLVMIGAVLFIAFGLLSGYAFYRHYERNADFRIGQLNRLTSTGNTLLATVSPDGKLVAYVQKSNAGESLWIRQTTGDGNAQIIAPAEVGFRGLTFSPNGGEIYYLVNNESKDTDLYRISALGGAPRKVTAGLLNDKPGGISFAPDGKRFAFFRKDQTTGKYLLMTAEADGTREEVFSTLDTEGKFVGSPAWSPDGATILCPHWRNDGYYNVRAVKAADRSVVFVLPDKFTSFNQLAWLPDSKNFIMIAADEMETSLKQFWKVSVSDARMERLNASDFYNYESFGVTAAGRRLAAVRLERAVQIWTMPSGDASRIKQMTEGFEQPYGLWGLSWTANDQIVFETEPSGKTAMMMMNADGGDQRTLISGRGIGLGAASPDARFYAYQKTIPGTTTTGLFVFDTVDHSERQLTTGTEGWAAFAPDNRTIVFSRYEKDDSINLWKVSVTGGDAVQLTGNRNLICPDISPDGKFIAAIERQGDERRLVILSIDGGVPVKSFPFERLPGKGISRRRLQWTPDGSGINFARTTGDVSNIWRQPVNGGAPVQITNFTTEMIFNFVYSPDGSQLALSRGQFQRDVILIENAE